MYSMDPSLNENVEYMTFPTVMISVHDDQGQEVKMDVMGEPLKIIVSMEPNKTWLELPSNSKPIQEMQHYLNATLYT